MGYCYPIIYYGGDKMAKSRSICKPDVALIYSKTKRRSMSIPTDNQTLLKNTESVLSVLFRSILDKNVSLPIYPDCTIISNGNAKQSNVKTILSWNRIISDPDFSIFFNCNIYSKSINDTTNPIYKYLYFTNPASTTIQSVNKGATILKSHGNGKALSTTLCRDTIIFPNDIDKRVIESKPPLLSTFIRTEVSFVSTDISNIPKISDSVGFSSINLTVEDDNPPSGISGSSSSGTSMKSLKLTIQKNSYIEHLFSFGNNIFIKDISGLPSGIIFAKNYLKGSPTISGKYSILIKLSDNSSIPGTIIVTQMHRKL
jgi:hypothetical protein